MCQFKSLKKKPCVNDPIPDIIWVLDEGKATVIPAPVTDVGNGIYNTIQTDITIDPAYAVGDRWQKIELRNRSGNFKIETQGEKDANQHKKEMLTGFYPESDEEAMYKLGMVTGWEGQVAWKNGNGKQVLWGTLANRVELVKADFDASQGGWNLEFERIVSGIEGSPPFYTGTIEE